MDLKLLPKNWRWVKLGEVCEFEYGSSLPEYNRVNGLGAVYGSNGIVGYHNETITQGQTIIIGRKGSIGQVNFSEASCWPIDTTYYIDSSKTQCDLIWFFWLLKWLKLDLLNKATGVPGLNREDAYSQLVPLPPMDEQHRIAAKIQELMQEISNLKSAISNQLDAAQALPSAYLREVFESPEAKKWERKRLREVCEVEKGKTPSESHYNEKGFRVIKYRDIKDDRTINWEPGFRSFVTSEYSQSLRPLFPKTTLIGADAHDPSSIGKKVAYVESIPKEIDLCYYSGELIGIRVMNENMIDSYWPFLCFISDYGYRVVQTFVDGVHLNKGQAVQMPIPLPPLHEQERIATDLKEKMSESESLRSKILNQQSTIDALPQAILCKAFRGEL